MTDYWSLTVSLSIRRTFIPGPLSSIILVTYCFTAKMTFMVLNFNLKLEFWSFFKREMSDDLMMLLLWSQTSRRHIYFQWHYRTSLRWAKFLLKLGKGANVHSDKKKIIHFLVRALRLLHCILFLSLYFSSGDKNVTFCQILLNWWSKP